MQRWPEFRQPLFRGMMLLYLALKGNHYLLHWPLPQLVTSYAADVLALPILLTLVAAGQRRLGPTPQNFVLPDSWLVAAWAYVSLVFEGLLPLVTVRAVADPLDVAAYALGTCLFRCWLNYPVTSIK